MFRKLVFFLALVCTKMALFGAEIVQPLIVVGEGYYDAGTSHSGGVFQAEYRFGRRYLRCLRPQAVLITPNFNSLYFGLGFGVELFVSRHFVITPSFGPGIYYKGSGRDLGYPLEFRSTIEIAYQALSGTRLGFQFYHISNGSLSNKNPGANAAVFILAIPFGLR